MLNTMLTEERRTAILEQLYHIGSIQTSSISANLGVSEVTVRSDLVEFQSMYSATAISRSPMLFHGPFLRTSSALNSDLNASARALSYEYDFSQRRTPMSSRSDLPHRANQSSEPRPPSWPQCIPAQYCTVPANPHRATLPSSSNNTQP